MNKEERINQFLVDVLNAKQNGSINSKCIYSMLVRNDVELMDIGFDASQNGNFDRWCQEYGRYNSKNIETFVDKNWSYFCQFKNRHQEVMQKEDQVKVYIPLDGKHLTFGVEEIFNFLEKNNIAHVSKVGKHIRFDDVVIRLGNLEDAEKLSQFVSNNEYIQEGLIKSNPFAVDKNGIAYASDKDISYNETVVNFINLYVDNVLQTGNYQNFGVEGFKNYILNYYNEVLIKPNSLQKIESDFGKEGINNKDVYNYMRVTELIYKSLDPNFTYNDYCDHFNKNISNYYRNPELAYFNSENYDYLKVQTPGLTEELENPINDEQKVYGLMKKALIEFGKKTLSDGTRKYSNDDVYAQIFKYLDTGDATYITNFGGLRESFIKNDFRTLLSDYVCQNGLKFSDIVLESKRQILEEALYMHQNKYGDEYNLAYPIKKIIDYDSYIGFTRSNGVRDNVAASIDKSDISKIIMKEMNYPLDMSLNNLSIDSRNQIINQYIAIVKAKKNNDTRSK